MKRYFYIPLLFLAVFYSACDDPAPTELIADETFEVEILGKDLDNEFYSNGYDTSGISDDLINYSSYLAVSGIKLTIDGRTDNISSAQVYIFDKSKPFRSPKNKVLIGYNTIIPGIIRFDNVIARLSDYRIRYREAGILVDTVLGKKYELFNLNNRPLFDPFVFRYNSAINFSYNPFQGNQTSSFNIITPKEITGNVRVIQGANNKMGLEIMWNAESVDNFYLILGGTRVTSKNIFPFYRLRTNDDGKLIIPNSLLKNIPKEKFDKFVVTLVRKYDKVYSFTNTDLYVVSQSIHSIVVDIP